MARFAVWWDQPGTTTPSSVAAAAAAAGVLVESGSYTVGALDLEDGGPPIGIEVSGSVIDVDGDTWLVYPGASVAEGWRGSLVDLGRRSLRARAVPHQLGSAYDEAERIVEAMRSRVIQVANVPAAQGAELSVPRAAAISSGASQC